MNVERKWVIFPEGEGLGCFNAVAVASSLSDGPTEYEITSAGDWAKCVPASDCFDVYEDAVAELKRRLVHSIRYHHRTLKRLEEILDRFGGSIPQTGRVK